MGSWPPSHHISGDFPDFAFQLMVLLMIFHVRASIFAIDSFKDASPRVLPYITTKPLLVSPGDLNFDFT
jgi:hypothetical protein